VRSIHRARHIALTIRAGHARDKLREEQLVATDALDGLNEVVVEPQTVRLLVCWSLLKGPGRARATARSVSLRKSWGGRGFGKRCDERCIGIDGTKRMAPGPQCAQATRARGARRRQHGWISRCRRTIATRCRHRRRRRRRCIILWCSIAMLCSQHSSTCFFKCDEVCAAVQALHSTTSSEVPLAERVIQRTQPQLLPKISH
jgi:hypothetical protein